MSNGKPPRRRSIFGGLVLILIGLLLLVSNFNPELQIKRLFFDFWPVLLIIWGLAKLFDYFASRRTGEASPPAFSGGEFFLLLLILFVGGAMTTWYEVRGRVNPDDLPIWLGGTPYTFSVEAKEANVKPDSRVIISVDRGDINVLPEDTNEIRVLAKKTVTTTGREEEARRRADDVKVEIVSVSGGYEVRQTDRFSERGRVRVDLEVHLPKKMSVEMRTVRGSLSLSGLSGGVVASARSGDIEIRNIEKDVQVEMTGGDLRVGGIKGNLRVTGRGSEIEIADVQGDATVEGEFSGLRFAKVGKITRFVSRRTDLTVGELVGNLELGGGRLELLDARGNFSVVTREKDIRLENVAGRVTIQNRRGNIELRLSQPPKSEIEVDNEAGSVQIAMPANSEFEISASTRGGEVETEFGGPELSQSSEKRVQKLEGKVGARGPRIRIHTTYDGIRLRKIG